MNPKYLLEGMAAGLISLFLLSALLCGGYYITKYFKNASLSTHKYFVTYVIDGDEYVNAYIETSELKTEEDYRTLIVKLQEKEHTERKVTILNVNPIWK